MKPARAAGLRARARHWLAAWAAACLAWGLGTPAQAQPLPSTQSLPSAQLSGNQLVAAASMAGATRCATAVQSVSQRTLTGVRRHEVLADWDRTHPEAGLFLSLTALEYQDVSALLSLSVQPLPDNRCAILAERISSAPLTCRDVARSELSSYHARDLVRAVTVYTSSVHPQETVTLVDVPPSCLILRRQVDFSWPAAAAIVH
jgi:hypothetical protein